MIDWLDDVVFEFFGWFFRLTSIAFLLVVLIVVVAVVYRVGVNMLHLIESLL